MGKVNVQLDAARKAYREALEAARANPTAEAWARLLAAGKELSSAQEPKGRTGRRRRAEPRGLVLDDMGHEEQRHPEEMGRLE
jgi:hypothetical protein